jgi:hypothetical protein
VTDPIVITVYPVGYSSYGQLFDGKVGERLLVRRSRQPLLDGCRVLLAEGVDPAAPVEMRHDGADGYLRSTVGAAAGLTVEEGERAPTFRPWKASPRAAGTPPMRQTEAAATTTPREAA